MSSDVSSRLRSTKAAAAARTCDSSAPSARTSSPSMVTGTRYRAARNNSAGATAPVRPPADRAAGSAASLPEPRHTAASSVSGGACDALQGGDQFVRLRRPVQQQGRQPLEGAMVAAQHAVQPPFAFRIPIGWPIQAAHPPQDVAVRGVGHGTDFRFARSNSGSAYRPVNRTRVGAGNAQTA